jgi:hypothetical protein
MPATGLQSLVNYGSVSVIRSLRARGVIPDFAPADWLQTAVTANNNALVEYLCEEIVSASASFPNVTTCMSAMVTVLTGAGYPSDQLVSAALLSHKQNCITAVLAVVTEIENADVIEQIIDRAGQNNIGAILLNFCNSHPEKINCVVSRLIANGNAGSLSVVCGNSTAASLVRSTSAESLRALVVNGACSTIEVILGA